MTFKELLLNNPDRHLTYVEYLATEEWERKRNEIIERDGHVCTNCNKAATFYIKNFNSPTKYHLWNVAEQDNRIIPLKSEERSRLIHADKAYHLEVHHKRYILNRLPWEFSNDDLVTLCNHCHEEFHRNNAVQVYNEDGKIRFDYELCNRCDGNGYLSKYISIQEGICFKCLGEKYLSPLMIRESV